MTKKWICLEDVSFVRSKRLILDNINWTISPGEHWAVVGSNGSGKTTLLQLLAGYLWPTQGRVTVMGEAFGKIDLRELRKRIGWVGSFLEAQIPPSQRPIDLVVSGKFASIGIFETPDAEDYRLAETIAARLECADTLDRPYGVLSQGEKQRLLIARALIHRPELLILDEPCAGLDIVSREYLLHLLQGLGESADAPTMIMVTHHLQEIMPVFSRVFLLKGGKCLAKGNKEEMLRSETLSRAFGIPVEVNAEEDRYWTRVALSG